MALALHASTPAPTTWGMNTATATTASFSPPASSVIFIVVSTSMGASGSQQISSVTDNLATHLAWAQLKSAGGTAAIANPPESASWDGEVEVWWAVCASAQTAMTVTVTLNAPSFNVSGTAAGLLSALVFSGAASTQNGAVATTGTSSASGAPSRTLTTAGSGSLCYGAVRDWTGASSPTTDSGQSTTLNAQSMVVKNSSDGDSWWLQGTTATQGSAGSIVTIGDSAPTGITYAMVAFEVLAASGGGGGGASVSPPRPSQLMTMGIG